MKSKLSINELIIYEAPAISEYISISFIQDIISSFIAWKVNRKMERYNKRKIKYGDIDI